MKTKTSVFNIKPHPRAFLGTVLFASIALLSPASAGTTWDGGGADNNWGTGANWGPDGAPTVGAAVDLTFDGSARLTPFNNYSPSDDFHSILFAATAQQFDVGGNAIDLFGKLENHSPLTQTVSLASLSINAGQPGTGEINPVNGDLVINSANVFTNGNAVRIFGANNRQVTFGAGTVISQGGEFILEQANTVVFQSAHTYTGDTQVKAGTLAFAAGGSADWSTIRIGGPVVNSGPATVSLTETSGGQLLTSTLVVQPSASGTQGLRMISSQNTDGTNTLLGDVFLDADLTTTVAEGGTLAFTGATFDLKDQTLDVTGGGHTSIGGVLQNSTGSGKVTKTGSGTLTLSGDNTFSGALRVEAGTLSVSNWNEDNANGPLGNSSLPVTLGGVSTMGTLRYTGGGSNNAPMTTKALDLAAGGGKVEMVYATGTRDLNYIHINGSKLTGSGGLTVDTISGGATSRFIIVGSASYTGPTVVMANSELQTNYATGGVDGTPFGAGLNGLGSAVTVESGARLTFFSFGNDTTVALGSLSGSGIVQGEGAGTHTFKIGGDNTSTTFSGVIQDNGGRSAITKVGSGTLTLSGTNTHTGLVTIDSGAISVSEWNLSGAAGPWGNAANDPAAPNATFIQMNGGRINYTGLTAGGALRGVNLVSGNNTIDVIAGSTLNFGGGFNTFQSNGGNLIKEGVGTLQIGTFGVANNIFTGKVSINAGTLDWFGAGSMPEPSVLVEDFITINNGGTFQLSYADQPTMVSENVGFKVSGNTSFRTVGTHTIPGVIGDGASAGSITKRGPGHLGFTGANTYTGTLTVEEGELSTDDWNNNSVNGPLGNSAHAVVLGGSTTQGTLRYSGPAFLPDDSKKGLVLNPGGGKVQLAMGPDRNSYVHLNGSSITGSGGLTVETAGGRFIVLESASYTGPTIVAANSELQTNYSGLGDGTPFGAGTNGLGSALTVNTGAFLTFYSYNAQSGPVAIGSLSGDGTVRGEGSGTHLFKIGGDGTNTTFSGVIMDSFNAVDSPTALSKVGPGTLTLSGQNSYTGATTIDSGTLNIQGSISGSTVTVNGGTLAGSGGLVGPTTVNAGGTLAPGTGIGTLNFGDSLVLAGSSVFEINKTGLTLGADLASVTGALTLGGTLTVTASGDSLAPGDSFNLFDAGSFSGAFTTLNLPTLAAEHAWNTANLAVDGTITVIPEPGIAWSLLGGLGILASLRRRRA